MKPFRFSLESLLRLREADRDGRRMDLASAIAEQQRLQTELGAIETRLAEQRAEDRRLRLSGSFSLELLRRSEARRQSLTAESSLLSDEVAAAALRADACQQRLAEAERDFQAVSKLREARHAEYGREMFRQEAKLADELAGRRFGYAA